MGYTIECISSWFDRRRKSVPPTDWIVRLLWIGSYPVPIKQVMFMVGVNDKRHSFRNLKSFTGIVIHPHRATAESIATIEVILPQTFENGTRCLQHAPGAMLE